MNKTYKFRGEWKARSAGGCLNHSTWRYNPQLFLTAKDKTQLTIKLIQESTPEKHYHIGFYIAKSDGSGRRQLALSRPQLIDRASFEDSADVSLEIELAGSPIPYIIIPCTFNPKEEAKFTMTFTTSAPILLEPLSPAKEWKQVPVEGEWAGKMAGGCKNNPSCSNNPQYLLQILEKPTNIHVLLIQEEKPDFDHIGFYIQKTSSSTLKLAKISSSDLVGKADFATGKEAYWNGTLDQDSMYVIVPCTFDPGWEAKFKLTILTDHPVKIKKLQEAKGLSVSGEWLGVTAGGCINHHTWRNNPQYLLTIKSQITTTLTLRQFVSSAPGSTSNMASIGFYCLKGSNRKHLFIKPSDLVGKGSFETRDSVTAEITFPGPSPDATTASYIIIPCTFYPKSEAKFQLTVSPHGDVNTSDVKLEQMREGWSKYIFSGLKWSKANNTVGGCRNHASWLSNPQFNIKVPQKTELAILISQSSADNSIGFYLVKTTGDGRVTRAVKEDIVVKSIFRKDEDVSVESECEPGTYNLVACMFDHSIEGTFDLSVYAWNCSLTVNCLNLAPEVSIFVEDYSEEKAAASTAANNKESREIARTKSVEQMRTENSTTPPQSPVEVKPGKGGSTPDGSKEEGREGRTSGTGNREERKRERSKKSANSTPENNDSDKEARKDAHKDAHRETSKKKPEVRATTQTPIQATASSSLSLSFNNLSEAQVKNNDAIKEEKPVSKSKTSMDAHREKMIPSSLGHTSMPNLTSSTELHQSQPWEIDWDEIQLEEKIGQGGFGVVYKGSWRGTTVAVKKLLNDDMDEADYKEFVREVEIMSGLRHPHVVLFLGACVGSVNKKIQAGSPTCLVTEFLARGNLAQVLKADSTSEGGTGKLDWKIKLMMARQAAQGMNYLHQNKPKIVHRDLKSLNLLVDENYNVKVADFGLSKVSNTGNTMNSKVGSLNWCAPEVLLHAHPYTDKADVYSFGMVLWEMITHKAPFAGLHPLQIVRAIDKGSLPEIPKNSPSTDFSQLINDCWAKEPDGRPSFAEILERLKKMEASFREG
eukprot:TRINITY_DN18468_c0_g1_i1.p1 TRINITY_DN18468_c0_g1~~TRINITY_DN18468_c0_g1_i1.p1  ORF type:complete len:1043 (-),score=184.05 TRINITY_DN18468_c0_g1_i1:31-3159(-)